MNLTRNVRFGMRIVVVSALVFAGINVEAEPLDEARGTVLGTLPAGGFGEVIGVFAPDPTLATDPFLGTEATFDAQTSRYVGGCHVSAHALVPGEDEEIHQETHARCNGHGPKEVKLHGSVVGDVTLPPSVFVQTATLPYRDPSEGCFFAGLTAAVTVVQDNVPEDDTFGVGVQPVSFNGGSIEDATGYRGAFALTTLDNDVYEVSLTLGVNCAGTVSTLTSAAVLIRG